MNILTTFRKNPKTYSWLGASILILIAQLHMAITNYPYDSNTYWKLSTLDAITNFPDVVRGYVYAVLLLPIHLTVDALGDTTHLTFKIISSLIYAFVLTGPTCDFFARCFGGTISLERRFMLALLTFILYPGLFLYPLSDLPAIILIIIGISLADSSHKKYWPLSLILSGAAIYSAYNIRTIYIFSAISIALVIPFVFFKRESAGIKLLAVMAFIAGGLCIATPQILINKRIHNIATPLIYATVNGKSLMATQLFWGVTVQRYETYDGKDTPAPSLYYLDPAGIKLRSLNEALFASSPSIISYFKFVSQHPIQFLGIYGRHFFNGIDIRDGIVYSKELSTNKNIISLGCATLFFFLALILYTRNTRKNHSSIELAYISPLIIPVLAILPGAVETRFFLPLYLVLIGATITQFKWTAFKNLIKEHWVLIGSIYAIFSATALAITATAMASVVYQLP